MRSPTTEYILNSLAIFSIENDLVKQTGVKGANLKVRNNVLGWIMNVYLNRIKFIIVISFSPGEN